MPSILISFLFLFSLSDSAAVQKARNLWGAQGGINKVRKMGDTYWTTQVGVSSPQCAMPFTPFGTGVNTWDAAFDDAATKSLKIHGPFSGTITIQAGAWDDTAVDKMALYVDGWQLGADHVIAQKAQWVTITATFNTVGITNGKHVLCLRAWDTSGNMGGSIARVFEIDQTKPGLTTWDLIAETMKPPSLPMGRPPMED